MNRNLTMLIGMLTSVPLMVAAMFVTTDYTQIMNSAFPAVELIFQVTGNRSLTIFLGALLVVCFACKFCYLCPCLEYQSTFPDFFILAAMPPQFTASGRIAWAFARDGGLPYTEYFAHIDTKKEFPARATSLALVFNALYGLLYLASTTAFNSILTSAVLYINITLVAPQTVLLLVGRDKALPDRPFKLGYVGYFCNIFATLWIPVVIVMVCMPPSLPVTVESMNYTSPIMVGLFIIIIGLWYGIGHQFEGPNIDWELLNLGNRMESEIKNH